MSRVGKLPIPIPEGVDVVFEKEIVKAKGPKGELFVRVHPNMDVKMEDGRIEVKRPNDQQRNRELHGLTRSLLNNMITGVTNGFEKKLEIIGVGYRAVVKSGRLVLNLGYSHQIVFIPPEEITVSVEGTNLITVSGIDKQLVGEVAAKIRSFRPPEPYKGKGIRYVGEYVRQKAGKTAG